ncbi:MAG TPA: radical SAM protein, partial [Anaerolineales bacterium]|nr:radical SAM protein [Anaerolineales bacterium]
MVKNPFKSANQQISNQQTIQQFSESANQQKITHNAPRHMLSGISTLLASLFTAPSEPPTPGLYTYRITPAGGHVRIHLRIEADGSGVMFRDVTDVIHLNPTAAEMAKLALDGIPLLQAQAGLRARYHDPGSINHETASIYELVETLKDPTGCATCAIQTSQERRFSPNSLMIDNLSARNAVPNHAVMSQKPLYSTPLFSVRVHAPYKVDLALTYGCNNECPHCYNEPDRYHLPSMPKEDWFKVIDQLHEMGVPHLILTGGEATLHPELPDIIHYADHLGHIVGLNTNGRKIAHAPYMQTLADAGLNHVQITLGSCHPGVHDAMMGAKSFDQTVRGIRNALNSGVGYNSVHVITNTTLMRANMGHAEDIIYFLHDLGIRTFAMNGMIYSGGGFANSMAIPEDEMPALLIRVRDTAEELGMRFLWYTPTEYCRMSPVELEIGAKRCNAGEYSMCIEPNGDVLPCQSYYVAAGNILHDPWETIWNGDLFVSFRDRELDPRGYGLPEKCWECPDLPLCGGGCRIEREARDGHRIAEDGGSTGG